MPPAAAGGRGARRQETRVRLVGAARIEDTVVGEPADTARL